MSSNRSLCGAFPILFLVFACSASPDNKTTTPPAGVATPSDYVRSERTYHIPDAILVDAFGKSVSLAQELEADEPIMLNFIYTRCDTIGPAMSASFADVQRLLGPEMRKLRLVTITIDPEYDSTARLRAYAKQHRVGRGWMLLTGRKAEIVPVLKAFETYTEDKADNPPVTLLRASASAPWVRIDGVVSGSQLVGEYRQLVSGVQQTATVGYD